MKSKSSKFWPRLRVAEGEVTAQDMIRRADAARDEREFHKAAMLYEQALVMIPDNAAIQIQCGHMFKEAGRLADAETHYKSALALTPEDSELALQMGHFFKTCGRPLDAARAYAQALALAPDLKDAASELVMLRGKGLRIPPIDGTDVAPAPSGSLRQPRGGVSQDFEKHVAAFGILNSMEGLAPELAPRSPQELVRTHHEGVHVRRFGRSERPRWGSRNTVRGVEAVRGYCLSSVPIVEVQMTLGGVVIHKEGPLTGAILPDERENTSLRKYFFNIWYDFGALTEGQHHIEIRLIDAKNDTRVHHEHVVVASALSPATYPSSDAVVTVSETDPRSIADQINSQPSMVRPAKRSVFAAPPKNVLVVRIDQLGDMCCSVPALRRLRELLPDARITGLISPGNAALVASLGLFDEVVLADIPDDPVEQRRVMPLAAQRELRLRLAAFKFDLALDMSESGSSRPLLLLSGAPFLCGIGHRNHGYLNFESTMVTQDFVNDAEAAPHATKMMGFIESLGTLMRSHAAVVPRLDLSRSVLSKYGIGPTDKFVVFHSGARIVFSRWPHYDQLSQMVLEKTGLKVILLTDDPAMRARLPQELTGSDRFRLLDQRLPFDDFDALVTYCSAFVGNDSGPKHLASLRGANVVSIHCARNNWNEWGQENSGYIISRRVPCAGCQIHHNVEECGRDFVCVTNVMPEEVFKAISEFF